MPRKSFLYLLAILALSVALAPLGATAQPAAPNAAAESVGNEQLPTARDLELVLDGAAAPAARPANPAAILFDNGPLTTHPGGGAGGADASAMQTALGLTIFGFGHAISSGFRMADDFTVPAGGWNISTVTFYAYQTGSTTTTTINNVNLRIWNGVPGAGGSSVVFGDTTTNRLAGSSFSNIYRVTDTALTGSTRPIMADVVTVNTTLPAGAYWLDWQTGGTLASGPWAPPVSILGQTAKPGANGLQYNPTAGTWGPALDGAVQQDLPFFIESQVPAISLSKTVGTQAGVCATTGEISVPAGTTVYYCYTVTNTGDATLNLHDLTDDVLGTVFTGFSYALTPGSSVNTVQAGLSVPYVANASTTNTATWTAYNEGGPSATATDTATVTVQAPGISLSKTVGTEAEVCATTDEITLPPGGGRVTYCYEVTNTGNMTLNRHDVDDSELGTLLNTFPYSLAPGASAFLTETTTIAVTTVNTATWRAYNEGGPSVTATDTATVTVQAPAISLSKTVGTTPGVCAMTDSITVAGGTEVYYCYQVRNTGNVAFNRHDLVDSKLGTLLDDLPYVLAPGALSPQVIVPATPMATVTNVGTWTAFNAGGLSATATDTATVTVRWRVYLPGIWR